MSASVAGTPKERFAEPGFYFQQDYFIEIRCQLVREFLKSAAGASVLDLGCGDGRVSLQFCEEASSVTLVDFSAAMLDRARQRIPAACSTKVSVVQSDVETFSPNRRFDVVLCLGVISHLPSVRDAILKISSLLTPRGIAIVQLTDAGTFLGRLALKVERQRARWTKASSHWLRPVSLAELAQWGIEAGLTMDGVRRHGVLLPGAGRLPNSVLLAWERFVIAHPRLSISGADAIVRFRKETK